MQGSGTGEPFWLQKGGRSWRRRLIHHTHAVSHLPFLKRETPDQVAPCFLGCFSFSRTEPWIGTGDLSTCGSGSPGEPSSLATMPVAEEKNVCWKRGFF